ncbi:hypothetical protein F13_0025 [Escherichia phage F13]|uniref:Uncharacterized protein n=1 Tax=Escherichia phage vB_EcoM_SP13 TaxID=2981577 RepID=A0A9X9JS50_9CAUD|nr:hypothetical protein SP13_006 [Escherichia phage vB_EcoM_SP13]UYE90919.1 hypothetical protein SP13_109 [Escherichia phage vB_EcoM_SP13]WAQ79444.1 hypothetical protein F13_0025 [Escherichia phage F13]
MYEEVKKKDKIIYRIFIEKVLYFFLHYIIMYSYRDGMS